MAWRERNRAELEEKKFCNKLFCIGKNITPGRGKERNSKREKNRKEERVDEDNHVLRKTDKFI